MAVKECQLDIDIHKHEHDNRGTPMFPCGGYITKIGSHLHSNIPWHCHEEIEVLVVCKGKMEVELTGCVFQLCEGEGAFINSGVLQSATAVGEEDCEIQSLVFHPNLIDGMPESAIEQRYVQPVLECGALPGIHFNEETSWHKAATQCIFNAFEAYRTESFGYELLVRKELLHLWHLISTNYQALICQPKSIPSDSIRLKLMLEFIHSHYAEQIVLSDIAKTASVSERECLRCFKRTIRITPMQYLLKYRISVAARLITTTNKSITEICRETGFESPSYFSSTFRKYMEKTPKEYRKM